MSNNQFLLLDYWFSNIKLNFKKETLSEETSKRMKFKNHFERHIEKINKDKAIVKLDYSLVSNIDSFASIEIELCGLFECTNWESDQIGQQLIKNNAPTILFPYLRHCISEITTISGMPPLVLPITDVPKLFE